MSKTIETTKPAAKILLRSDRQTIDADGRDLAVVTVEIQDIEGHIVPDASPLLTFCLDGDGRILGVGNGDPSYLGADHPQGKDCKTFVIPAFNGLAQLLIQSGHNPSTLTLRVISDGLKTGTIHVTTK